MQIILERETFLSALAHLQPVVEKRNTLPILAHILLEANGDRLTLTATDRDLQVVETLEADIQQQGAITLPAQMLLDIVRRLPEGAQLEITSDGNQGQVKLVSGRTRFTLSSLQPEDFPRFSADEDFPVKFEMASGDLAAMIDHTRACISSDETRYYLCGIYFHLNESEDSRQFRSVATDGHRMAVVDVPCDDSQEGFEGIIIPRKTVGEIYRLAEASDEPAGMALSERLISVHIGAVHLTSRLIQGTFPDYRRVIPKTSENRITLETRSLKEALERVMVVTSQQSRVVRMGLEGSELTLSASNAENGQSEEKLEVESKSESLTLGFTANYLLDLVAQIQSENMTLELGDLNTPTTVNDNNKVQALYVLMPARV